MGKLLGAEGKAGPNDGNAFGGIVEVFDELRKARALVGELGNQVGTT
jgi:hypothetical protein